MNKFIYTYNQKTQEPHQNMKSSTNKKFEAHMHHQPIECIILGNEISLWNEEFHILGKTHFGLLWFHIYSSKKYTRWTIFNRIASMFEVLLFGWNELLSKFKKHLKSNISHSRFFLTNQTYSGNVYGATASCFSPLRAYIFEVSIIIWGITWILTLGTYTNI